VHGRKIGARPAQVSFETASRKLSVSDGPTAVFRNVGVPVPHRSAKGHVSGRFLAPVAHLIRVSRTQFQQGLAALRVARSCELTFLLTQR
jgi:hypothetical protein